jgi:hypothetical protein
MVYCRARARSGDGITSLMTPVNLLCLAPFLGAESATQFIDSRSAEEP